MTCPIARAVNDARRINGDYVNICIMYTHDGNYHVEFMNNNDGKFTGIGETLDIAVSDALHKMNGTQMPLF